MTVLAQFARGRSVHGFTRALLGLLDDHGDAFRANVEALPLDERRAFWALCDHWAPAFARDVAHRARFGVNKTSMLLGRLERRGVIETVGKRGRAKQYEVSARLDNLVALVLRGGAREARLMGSIEFMARYYWADHTPAVTRAHHVELALARRDHDAGLRALETLLREPAQGPSLALGSVRALLELGAARPAETHERLAHVPALAPIAVALAMDLDLPHTAPREVVEVARDVLEDIRAQRQTVRYAVEDRPALLAADDT